MHLTPTQHANFFSRMYYQYWSDKPMGDMFYQVYGYLFIGIDPGISNDRIYAPNHINAILKRNIKHLYSFDVVLWEKYVIENFPSYCPFCGKTGVVLQHKGILQKDGRLSMKDTWYVGCPDLSKENCVGPSASWYNDLKEALCMWNSREDKVKINNAQVGIKV